VAKLFFNVSGLHNLSDLGAHSLRIALPQTVNGYAHSSFIHAKSIGKNVICDLVIIT
jgi:hypothetical protein